MHHFVRLAAAW